MPRQLKARVLKPTYQIMPSASRGDYYWRVTRKKQDEDYDGIAVLPEALKYGHSKSFDQALRNARNFIKNNQNAVYG